MTPLGNFIGCFVAPPVQRSFVSVVALFHRHGASFVLPVLDGGRLDLSLLLREAVARIVDVLGASEGDHVKVESHIGPYWWPMLKRDVQAVLLPVGFA